MKYKLYVLNVSILYLNACIFPSVHLQCSDMMNAKIYPCCPEVSVTVAL